MSMEHGPTPPDPIVPVVQRPGYRIGLEQFGGATFGHISVFHRWTPALKAAVRADIDAVMALHGGPIHTLSTYVSPNDVRKHAKFVAQMGFTLNTVVTCPDGVDRPVYTRWR